MDGHTGPHGDELRAEVIATMRQHSTALASDLSAAIAADNQGQFPAESVGPTATVILSLLTSAIEHGEVNPRAGAVHDLERVCATMGARRLAHAIEAATIVTADELALDERLGMMSEPWPIVLQLVRSAGYDLLGAFAARLVDAPAYGAVRDPLTTLLARPVFDVAIEQEVHRAHRHNGSFALLLFDVDNLSQINRDHGYGAGDRLLERLGILARRFFRTHDWVARYDEDSLVVLLPQTTLDQAERLATRFCDTVRQRLVLVEHTTDARVAVTLTASAVGAENVHAVIDPALVLAEAESAVTRAKLDGKNRTYRVALAPPAVTVLGAATLLDCSISEVRRLVRQGQLKAARRGRHYHIARADIERLKQITR